MSVRVGITGQAGFVGYHLSQLLRQQPEKFRLIPFEDSYFDYPEKLQEFIRQCEVVVHLAGINRDPDPQRVYQGNIELAQKLTGAADAAKVLPAIIFSSSTQEALDNPYGRGKREARNLLLLWCRDRKIPFTGLVIPNVFGPFGRPFYNSFVATFCHQLTHGEEPSILQDSNVSLIYVGNLVKRIQDFINQPGKEEELVAADYSLSVSATANLLKGYRDQYLEKYIIPGFANSFERDLFNTFRSSIPADKACHELNPNSDARGTLYEVVKMNTGGQIFYSITKPGVTRGNHYHTRKIERFCVIGGEALIRLRRIGTPEVHEYPITADKPAFVDMPVLTTHNITNTGTTDLITLFWTNEIYDPADPDTFFENV
ncbi:MAG: NAD-dependent epimerase/dehydratase family protein [Bacteroidales bacterium]